MDPYDVVFEPDRMPRVVLTVSYPACTLVELARHRRLHAAAPALLAACRRAIPYLRDLVGRTAGEYAHGEGDAGDAMALKACEAALAQAEEP